MSTPLIELQNAGKNYLNYSFNISIKEGSCLLVHGKNGSGKTTLIHLLLGFVKPDFGKVIKKNMIVNYLSEKVMLPLYIKVIDYLENMAKIKRGEVDYNLLHNFKIPLFKGIHQLSKGNQQKLALATTMMGQAKLFILDEPLSGLDEESINVLFNKIKSLKEEGSSFVISTHQPYRFLSIIDETLEL